MMANVSNMVPPHYVGLFDTVAAQRGDGSVVLPFPIWRERLSTTLTWRPRSAHTTSSIRIHSKLLLTRFHSRPMSMAKSYINCTEDISLPHHYAWHPRLSQKLELFRLVQVPGGHELCFSNPGRLARAIMDAGRD
jgi:hypothetical protein